MTPSPQPPSDWPAAVGLLARLHPPHSVVHVGSQPAAAPSRVWQQWGVPHALLVDPLAEDDTNSTPTPGWHTRSAVLADQAHPAATFHTTSLQAESGLLPPQALRAVWPNIQAVDAQPCATVTLGQLWASLPNPPPAPNWLFVDSLPALPVLQGGKDLVASAEVLCVRVLLTNPAHNNTPPELAACTLPPVRHWLADLGFVCGAVVETRHPALALALFVPNWPHLLQQQVRTTQHLQAA